MDSKGKAREHGRPRSHIRFRTTMHGTVVLQVMLWRGWTEVEDEYDWDIFWSDVATVGIDSGFEHSKLHDKQRLNHFPRHMELTRKDLMVKNLKKWRRQLTKAGHAQQIEFWPKTFRLPEEFGMFAEAFRRTGGLWIMKPVGRCQGRGIFVVDRVSRVAAWKKTNDERDPEKREIYIVSKYIENPLLIGGKKFDLRLYALVLSYSPLKVYLHRGGFARFSAVRYTNDRESMKDLYVHLTNVAIQKKGQGYDHESGMKWPIQRLKIFLQSEYGTKATIKLFHEIQAIIIKSLLAVQHGVVQDKHCFELYGYDILVDKDLVPWLIEVNASPSLATDTAADFRLKFAMVDAALSLADVEGVHAGKPPASLNGFDLVWENGAAVQVHPGLPSLLGCEMDLPKNYYPEKVGRKTLRERPEAARRQPGAL
eukprot:jgi/Ulvmu1/12470/UM009_0122.1